GRVLRGGLRLVAEGRVQQEGVHAQFHLMRVGKLPDRAFQAVFADVAPWAQGVGPNVDDQLGLGLLRVASDVDQILCTGFWTAPDGTPPESHLKPRPFPRGCQGAMTAPPWSLQPGWPPRRAG